MAHVFLSLGSNLGDKEKNLEEAIQRIEKQAGKIIARSAFYKTEPWGFNSQNTFLNGAIEIETTLSPLDLLSCTQSIEKEMGRKKKSIQGAYTDRIIDIDILTYNELIYKDKKLALPHPHMTQRLFVMEPLAEIAANRFHPITGESFAGICKQLKNREK
ncbi:MAG: 2-amino-4-hydroxy-6-hydroxymethyldihydropteridine diphosphokinase [Tannerellaceae bacterium]|nr:2-amino-4-hydroxy-6-hydroxymethyldihydropteridine diphosphokinase [Tannerellaceae bacterium]